MTDDEVLTAWRAGELTVLANRYRYASTMGDRYAMPLYFDSLDNALAHQRNCDRLLGGLTGQDSMQVEEWRGRGWVVVD